jgi:hypothetical protein
MKTVMAIAAKASVTRTTMMIEARRGLEWRGGEGEARFDKFQIPKRPNSKEIPNDKIPNPKGRRGAPSLRDAGVVLVFGGMGLGLGAAWKFQVLEFSGFGNFRILEF